MIVKLQGYLKNETSDYTHDHITVHLDFVCQRPFDKGESDALLTWIDACTKPGGAPATLYADIPEPEVKVLRAKLADAEANNSTLRRRLRELLADAGG